MQIRPILSSLRRHKTAAALIVLEVALSCAILCNAIFLIAGRIEHMNLASGIAEDELVFLSASSLTPDRNADVLRQEDLAALAAVPGVKAVSSINQIPYGRNAWGSSLSLDPEQPEPTLHASVYLDGGQLLETFGLRIIDGRSFDPAEYLDLTAVERNDGSAMIGSVIVTSSLAGHLFPGERAVGRELHGLWGNDPKRIVGIIDDLLSPGARRTATESHHSILLPLRVSNGDYALRTDPQRRAEVLEQAVAALNSVDPNRIISERKTVVDMRHAFHSRDRAAVWLLLAVCGCLLAVTAFGIVGLASFWVAQRTRQIGIRRALGATRGDILRYFQVENFLLAGFGIVLGMLLAYAINQMLMSKFELARLPLGYLPAGAIALWLLGQVAVLGPARRAASVPPAVATRSA